MLFVMMLFVHFNMSVTTRALWHAADQSNNAATAATADNETNDSVSAIATAGTDLNVKPLLELHADLFIKRRKPAIERVLHVTQSIAKRLDCRRLVRREGLQEGGKERIELLLEALCAAIRLARDIAIDDERLSLVGGWPRRQRA